MKKCISLFAALTICLTSFSYIFTSAISLPSGVTEDMCKSNYWKDKTITDKDAVMMTDEQILAINKAGIDGTGTYMFDIENTNTINGYKQQQNLNPVAPAGKKLFIDGKQIDATELYNKINYAIKNTGYTETSMEPEYGVTVSVTEMRDIPIDKPIGYSASDPDDELLLESLTVNEPFLIRAKCTYDNKTYYYGYSLECPGWICGDDLAICSSKEEWLSAWKCDIDGDDFIVVTTDKITLEKAVLRPNASELKLRLGTTLKLVEPENTPDIVGERGTWNNYIVYIPIRNDDGTYSKEIAMVSQHSKVNIGYLDFTQSNLLDVAFECLGNTYGWAGWLDSYDCSLYMCAIYRCFGIIIPRNASWQQKVPGTKYDLSAMDDETKQKFIETMPTGTLLFISGHVMMYLGTEDNTSYVISSLGTVVDSEGETKVKSVYSTCVTPLTVRRGASYKYKTWLSSIISAVAVMPQQDISACDIYAQTRCNDAHFNNYSLTVKLGEKELYKDVNYTIEQNENILTIKGTGFYTGEKQITIANPHIDSNNNDICDNCVCYISGDFFTHLLFLIKNFFGNIFSFIK